MKILITGSEGLIGTILKKELTEHELYCLDLKESNEKNCFKADISKINQLIPVFEKIGSLDAVIHLAADSRVNASWLSALQNNIIGTKNIFECAKLFGIRRIIFASSNHVTGAYEGFPPSLHKQKNPKKIKPNDIIRPDSDYGTSKAFGEILARQYFELYGINSICLRIGTVLEEDNPKINPRFLKTWLSHKDLTQIFRKSLKKCHSFGIYYAISDNEGAFYDITSAKEELGYKPRN